MSSASDSNPIQLWTEDEETFNEKSVCGIIKEDCFCQIFQSDDTITIQVPSTYGEGLILKIYDTDSVVVASQAMTQYGDYYETSFVPSDLSIPDGQYIFKIETAYVLTAEYGSFVLTGEDVALNVNNDLQMTADYGSFILTGQDVTFTVAVAILNIASEKVTGSSNRFKTTFSGSGSGEITLTGTNDSDSTTMPFGSTGNYTVTVSKTLPVDQLAEGDGAIYFYKNGNLEPGSGTIGSGNYGTQTFTLGEDLSAVVYNFTGLVSGDTVLTSIQED
jgi:hypothetical protein